MCTVINVTDHDAAKKGSLQTILECMKENPDLITEMVNMRDTYMTRS